MKTTIFLSTPSLPRANPANSRRPIATDYQLNDKSKQISLPISVYLVRSSQEGSKQTVFRVKKNHFQSNVWIQTIFKINLYFLSCRIQIRWTTFYRVECKHTYFTYFQQIITPHQGKWTEKVSRWNQCKYYQGFKTVFKIVIVRSNWSGVLVWELIYLVVI